MDPLKNSVENRYFIIHKPYDMVSQFVSPDKVNLLKDLDYDFPEGTHAIGRLDNNSEGLLLLTTNKKITRLLFSSKEKHERVYLVQINNSLSEENLKRLQNGVSFKISSTENYTTSSAKVIMVEDPEKEYPFIKNLEGKFGPHCWFQITLTEGKFHQVRKMVASIHHRCKRLIRISIENIQLGQLPPGAVVEMEENEFFEKLNLKR